MQCRQISIRDAKWAATIAVTVALLAWSHTDTVIAQNNQTPEIAVTYNQNNRITVEAYGATEIVKESHTDLTEVIGGAEQSQCRPNDYGRRSSATTSASTNVAIADATHLTASLRISALARGGHYRTCVAGCDPIGQNCIGIVGHDTRASGTATTDLHAIVKFGDDVIQDVYELKLSSSLPKDLKIRITGPDGSLVSPDPSGITRLQVKGNDVYYVDAGLGASVSNEGGCCNDEKTLAAQFDLQIRKPPILESKKYLEPYIIGGAQTSGYKYVVAILLRGELHCSGTVVGSHTILTAAHCINGYEEDIKNGQMTYLLGTIITSPQYGPAPISAATYPRGADTIQYNPATYLHDIGLLYTPAEIPAQPVTLHDPASAPGWKDLINKIALEFVGFGYNKSSAGDLIGAGVKREAPWEANKADDWRFYFQSAGHNTCSGDSGGPAFYLDEHTRNIVLVGITSIGDRDCTFGADTRMDAHFAWTAKLIR
jgi:hypothetical protein